MLKIWIIYRNKVYMISRYKNIKIQLINNYKSYVNQFVFSEHSSKSWILVTYIIFVKSLLKIPKYLNYLQKLGSYDFKFFSICNIKNIMIIIYSTVPIEKLNLHIYIILIHIAEYSYTHNLLNTHNLSKIKIILNKILFSFLIIL